MAQMAAQDYFSRLQMSGMSSADLASLQALSSGLAGYPNMNLNSSPSSSSSTGGGNKNNSSSSSSKRSKEKSHVDSSSYDKYSSALEVKKLSSKEAAASMQQQKNSNNYNQSYPSAAANLQKDFFAMAAAAAAASLDPSSLKDFKNVAAMQGNYVPNKNSNVNHNQSRGNNNKESNNRKSQKDTSENNYSSKRNSSGSSDHSSNYQNLFKESSNTSLLGVRLPPDTEIIKYTSSGSKMPMHNSYNQGSSLDISISPKRKRLVSNFLIMKKLFYLIKNYRTPTRASMISRRMTWSK